MSELEKALQEHLHGIIHRMETQITCASCGNGVAVPNGPAAGLRFDDPRGHGADLVRFQVHVETECGECEADTGRAYFQGELEMIRRPSGTTNRGEQ